MLRSDGRILTTHAGSLPRPLDLTRLYAEQAAGQAVDEAVLARLGEEATRASVRRQVEAGLDIVNNGEQPREAFFLYLRRRMSGFGTGGYRAPFLDIRNHPDFAPIRQAMFEGKPVVSNMEPPKVVGELTYLDLDACAAECRQFQAALAGLSPAGTFLTAPSPGIVASAIPNEHYASFDAYLRAITDAVAIEYKAIIDHGFDLQIDAPDLALEGHGAFADRPRSDFLQFVEQVIDEIRRVTSDLPRERIRLHACWGNYEGPHDADVPMSDVLPILTKAHAGALLLPLGNPRHQHEYRHFTPQAIPDHMSVIVGCIDTVTNYVEHPAVVADRIERVASTLGDPARVLAATDCGFDTSAGMGRVAPSVVWAKLGSLVEGARLASDLLF
jgi:5-methyltetrahydropteroyltriglutamate--homocysteine methyltransferase